MKPVLSFILPVFNEEETLEETYRRLAGILDSLKDQGEIILVDDGSRDRSLELMRDLRRINRDLMEPEKKRKALQARIRT